MAYSRRSVVPVAEHERERGRNGRQMAVQNALEDRAAWRMVRRFDARCLSASET